MPVQKFSEAGRQAALMLSRNHANTKHIPIHFFKGIYKHQHRTTNNMKNSVEKWCYKKQVFEVWLLEETSKISAFFTK